MSILSKIISNLGSSAYKSAKWGLGKAHSFNKLLLGTGIKGIGKIGGKLTAKIGNKLFQIPGDIIKNIGQKTAVNLGGMSAKNVKALYKLPRSIKRLLRKFGSKTGTYKSSQKLLGGSRPIINRTVSTAVGDGIRNITAGFSDLIRGKKNAASNLARAVVGLEKQQSKVPPGLWKKITKRITDFNRKTWYKATLQEYKQIGKGFVSRTDLKKNISLPRSSQAMKAGKKRLFKLPGLKAKDRLTFNEYVKNLSIIQEAMKRGAASPEQALGALNIKQGKITKKLPIPSKGITTQEIIKIKKKHSILPVINKLENLLEKPGVSNKKEIASLKKIAPAPKKALPKVPLSMTSLEGEKLTGQPLRTALGRFILQGAQYKKGGKGLNQRDINLLHHVYNQLENNPGLRKELNKIKTQYPALKTGKIPSQTVGERIGENILPAVQNVVSRLGIFQPSQSKKTKPTIKNKPSKKQGIVIKNPKKKAPKVTTSKYNPVL